MRTFVAEFFYSSLLMREFIIADNQDISKAGMMFLLSKQKEVSLLLEADNKAELIQQLRLHPQAVFLNNSVEVFRETKISFGRNG